MSNYLSTFKVIALYFIHNQKKYYFTNKSIISNNIFFQAQDRNSNFENNLFEVELDADYNHGLQHEIFYNQSILFRHKLSKKYLNVRNQSTSTQQNRYRIVLSRQKKSFLVKPCYQYQERLSKNLKFDSESLITTMYMSRETKLIIKKQKTRFEGFVDFFYSSQIRFHFYQKIEKIPLGFKSGKIYRLQHLQTDFIIKMNMVNNNQVVFEQISEEKEIFGPSDHWIIETAMTSQSNYIKYRQEIFFKNLINGEFWTVSDTFQKVKKERIYKYFTEKKKNVYNKFVLEEYDQKNNDYVNQSIYLFIKNIGNREYIYSNQNDISKNLYRVDNMEQTEGYALFRLKGVSNDQEELLRFICAIRTQFYKIDSLAKKKLQQIQESWMQEMEEYYKEIRNKIFDFQSNQTMLLFVKRQMGLLMDLIVRNVQSYRSIAKNKSDQFTLSQVIKNKAYNIMLIAYELLVLITKDYEDNQYTSFQFLQTFVQDLGQNTKAEEVIINTFKNNKKLLRKIPQKKIKESNLIKAIFDQFLKANSQKKVMDCHSLSKIIEILNTFVDLRGESIISNQNIISEELFQNEYFRKIFLPFKIHQSKITITEPHTFTSVPIQFIKNDQYNVILQTTFLLLANLSKNHNLISKKLISNYFYKKNPAFLSIMIDYLRKPIKKAVYNQLIKFITICYIDSFPRNKRMIPTNFVIFQIQLLKDQNLGLLFDKENSVQGILKDYAREKVSEIQNNKPWNNFSTKSSSNDIVQPSMSERQLTYFQENLIQMLMSANNVPSQEQIQALKLLIELEAYSITQMIQIFEMLQRKVTRHTITKKLFPKIFMIINFISKIILQYQTRKATLYFKYKLIIDEDVRQQEYKYVLPGSQRYNLNNKNKQNISILTFIQNLNTQFNQNRDIIQLLRPRQEFKEVLLKSFCDSKILDQSTALVKLKTQFELILNIFLPINKFLSHLSKMTVLTHQQVEQQAQYSQIICKIQNLTMTSQSWLNINEKSSHFKEFIRYVNELNNFFYQDYSHQKSSFKRKPQNLSLKRQLFIRSLGAHTYIIELLKNNIYKFSKVQSNKQLSKQCKLLFYVCFQFLILFIKKCKENRQTLSQHFQFLLQYQRVIQFGQLNLYREYFNQEKSQLRIINFQIIENSLLKIIKSYEPNKNYEICEYDPAYLRFIIQLMHNLGKESQKFVERIYDIFRHNQIFDKLFFIFIEEEDEKKPKKNKNFFQFNLKMQNLKIQPLQMPILYHHKLVQFFNVLFLYGKQSVKKGLRNKLIQCLSINQLFTMFISPDAYTHVGLQAELRLLLKKQLSKLILNYLVKKEYIKEYLKGETLQKFMQYLELNFRNQVEKKPLFNDNEAVYFIYSTSEYMQPIETKAQYYKYYLQEIIQKLASIYLEKNEKEDEKTQNQQKQFKDLPKKFCELAESLHKEFGTLVVQQQEKVYTMKDITLKWRNFVDDDKDNSKQQKFIKKQILNLLINNVTFSIVQQEKFQFYKALLPKQKNFIKRMILLIKQILTAKEFLSEINDHSRTLTKVLQELSQFLDYKSKTVNDKQRQQRLLQGLADLIVEQEFIDMFINLTCKTNFTIKKGYLKSIYKYFLKVFNFLLQNDIESKIKKIFYQKIKEIFQSYKLFQFFQMGIVQIINAIDSEKYYQQVQVSVNSMKMCIEVFQPQLYKLSFQTISYLCRYQHFTSYLRNQSSITKNIDFLDVAFNIMMFLFHQGNHAKKIDLAQLIKVGYAKVLDKILYFIRSMLIGGNKLNQYYVMQNKFGLFASKLLRIDTLKPLISKDAKKRENLLEEVISIYKSNGIQIGGLLLTNLKLMDFRQNYLLNRLKQDVTKTMIQTCTANDKALELFKNQMPLQILKLNLIWIYQAYKKGQYQYTQYQILRQRVDWNSLVDENFNNDPLYLRLGFYFYQLIDLIQEQEEIDLTNLDTMNEENEEKEKERICTKFFTTITPKHRNQQVQKYLENEFYTENMKYYYHTYYNSILFFKQRTGNIQLSFKSQIINVSFPLLPIVYKITQVEKQIFRSECNRVNRTQKLKSLMEEQDRLYHRIQGQVDYLKEMQSKYSLIGFIFNIIDYQDELLLAGLIISFFICIFHMLLNFMQPNHSLFAQMFAYINLSGNFLKTVMLILSVINLTVGVLLGFYLFTIKIPFYKSILQKRYQQKFIKNKNRSKKQQKSRFSYVCSQILTDTAYQFYIMLSLILTIMHPIFSSFPLVEIVNRIEIGRSIMKSIKQSGPQMFVVVGLLLVFNILTIQIIYVFFTQSPGYGQICKTQLTCMLMFTDQIFKLWSGVQQNDTFTYNVITFQLLYEIMTIVLGAKVMVSIFSGTLIDKFSQLRQKQAKIEEDQNKLCFICGMQRVEIDLQYEGFNKHIQQSHQIYNYIKYLFFIRRQKQQYYGFIQRYLRDLQMLGSEQWIPDNNSLAKQKKLKLEGKINIRQKVSLSCKQTLSELKQIRMKLLSMNVQLKANKKQEAKIVKVHTVM